MGNGRTSNGRYGRPALSLAFYAAIVFSAGAFAGSAEAATVIKLGYTASSDFLPAFVAKDEGFFEKRGLDVTPIRITVASTVPAALVGGSVQIGNGTGPGLLQATENGLPLQIVSGATLQSRDAPTVSVIAKDAAGISRPQDFVGKTVGVPGIGSVIDVIFRKWLTLHGVAVDKVHFVEAPFPQMGDMLQAGTVDAVCVLEPFRSRILSRNTNRKVADYFSEVKDRLPFGFWIATRSWLEQNEAAAHGFREALSEGEVWIKAHPEEAKKIEAKYLGAVSPGFPTYSVNIQPADLESYQEIGRELGLLTRNQNLQDLIMK